MLRRMILSRSMSINERMANVAFTNFDVSVGAGFFDIIVSYMCMIYTSSSALKGEVDTSALLCARFRF